ncbi:MAG: hypothetical protein HFE78_01925 [Clostridiales bacterium]|nr:hypothetical protein [Clostridiales bacterium]
MPEEKNVSDKMIDETTSELFTEKPSAPVAKREAAPQEQAQTGAARSAAKRAPAKTETKSRQTMTLADLQKLVNAPKPEKPMEKTPVWSLLLVVTAMVLSMIAMVMSFVAAYFYFRGAIMSQILCVVLGIVVVVFFISCAFMLRIIERGIREIKTKL